MSRRAAITILVLCGLLAGVVVLRLAAAWSPERGAALAFAGGEIGALRMQRIAAGVAVGACLAVGGVLLQSLLRNPLASPDVIGLASGAALAVALSTYLAGEVLPRGVLSSSAVLGSLGALAVVYALGQRRGLVEPISLVLVGVVVGIICGAGTMLLAHLMPERALGISRWAVGNLSDDVPPGHLWVVGALAGGGVALGAWLGPAMDAAAMGEDEARSVGVAMGRLRLMLFMAAGVLTAGAVALAGPVGFVGLVSPHVVRLVAGPSHRALVIGAALAGACLVVGADAATTLVRTGAGRMPIGILTALVGGPVFIVLLRHSVPGREQ